MIADDARNRRILVIDDNQAIHEDFRKILAGHGGGAANPVDGAAAARRDALDALEANLFGADATQSSASGASRRTKYELDSAFQGQDGFEMVRRAIEAGRRYALAFVDMRMPPGWDGLQTIEKIWSVDPEIQVVICTAYSDYSWEEIYEKLGAGDRLLILKKPFDTAEVCQLACALTEKWHLARHAHLKLNQLKSMVEEQTRELEAANRKLLEEVAQRQQSEDRYRLAANGANDGLWDWDLRGGKIYYSERWKSMLGLEDGDIGQAPDEWLRRAHADDLPALREALDGLSSARANQIRLEFRMLHKDGQYRWMLCRGSAVHDEAGRGLRAAGSLTDITDRKMAEEQLRFDAMHDALTGLANRTLLLDRLTHCVARARRDATYRFAVLFMDLDHFKVINDSLGHVIGDKLLTGIGRRLTACAREIDTVARSQSEHVARIGGDEFVLLLEELRDETAAVRVAERVHEALAAPFHIDGHEIVTLASVGIALSHERYERAEELLRDADTAMYQAKNAGKGCARIFDPEMHERAMNRWRIENELRRAVENDELVVHYQPIMTVDGRLASLEALVRWQHPSGRLIMPNDFMSIAEETGLIVPLGSAVMRAACRQLRAWQLQFPSLVSLSVGVNVSGRQFSLAGFADEVAKVLEETDLAAQCLRLEITETTAMQKADVTVQILTRLREMGVLFYLDDFGTGYSSLSYLHRMPIDALKIDRAFVATMHTDSTNRSIVQAVISLAQALDMRTIAEGVETVEQLGMVRKLGCDFAQGFHFCKPLEVKQMTGFISACCRQTAPEPALSQSA